mmetsp:Transcript_49614/g.97776  ORF Transcript_49614/g.97776 Transcript_49614/m.97776 type:complete len:216 (-) Transcript_49614:484-1131(-)
MSVLRRRTAGPPQGRASGTTDPSGVCGRSQACSTPWCHSPRHTACCPCWALRTSKLGWRQTRTRTCARTLLPEVFPSVPSCSRKTKRSRAGQGEAPKVHLKSQCNLSQSLRRARSICPSQHKRYGTPWLSVPLPPQSRNVPIGASTREERRPQQRALPDGPTVSPSSPSRGGLGRTRRAGRPMRCPQRSRWPFRRTGPTCRPSTHSENGQNGRRV